MSKSSVMLYFNQLKWFFLGGGPIFFLIRAIQLAITGGDSFSIINPIFSWFLLSLEIVLAGIAGSTGIAGLILWIRPKIHIKSQNKGNLRKIVFFVGISTYVVHFIRVAIWISL